MFIILISVTCLFNHEIISNAIQKTKDYTGKPHLSRMIDRKVFVSTSVNMS